MLRPTVRSLRSLLVLLAAGAALAACSDDDPVGPSEPGPVPVRAEVYLRGTDIRLADTHGDHWHGSVTTSVGVGAELDVRFLDADDAVVPLADGRTVRAELAGGEPTHVASVESHGDHVELTALAPGETRIVIHLWHDGHADWSTPALRVVVAGG